MQSDQDTYDDIIIAVHGIGNQIRNETVRSVATRLARIQKLANHGTVIAPQPLGYFYKDVSDIEKVLPVDRNADHSSRLARIGFSEVYWADVPQSAVNEGHTLEETKAWARTVVSRARAVFKRAPETQTPGQALAAREPDFTMAAEVLDEIVDTIYVLENLCLLARKAGLFDFNLRQILDEFVGDVQIFAEFAMFRGIILARFHQALQHIWQKNKQARLHIVAHSEGTVVAFIALLEAMSGRTWKQDPNGSSPSTSVVDEGPAWLNQIYGFLTIGSPIDKHILLWPELFEGYRSIGAPCKLQARPIQWRNYFDYGDPVGYRLDTARYWLSKRHIGGFDFKDCHDIGFARYLLPGKAHNDYWSDPAVFEHYVADVIPNSGVQAQRPKTRWPVYVISPSLPYFLSFLILLAGTLVLYRAVTQYGHAPLDSVQKYVYWLMLESNPKPASSGWKSFADGFGITLLIAGTTLFARWPRLASARRWWAWGALAFGVGCVGYVLIVDSQTRIDIGSFDCLYKLVSTIPKRVYPTMGPWWHRWGGVETLLVLGAALAVALIGMIGIGKPKPIAESSVPDQKLKRSWLWKAIHLLLNKEAKRSARWFGKHMRPLIMSGSLVIAALVGNQLTQSDNRLTMTQHRDIIAKIQARKQKGHGDAPADDRSKAGTNSKGDKQVEASAQELESLLKAHPPIWPVAFAGAVFLYMWWLSALVFDLAFIWQRYIRRSEVLERLKEWKGVVPPRLTNCLFWKRR